MCVVHADGAVHGDNSDAKQKNYGREQPHTPHEERTEGSGIGNASKVVSQSKLLRLTLLWSRHTDRKCRLAYLDTYPRVLTF